MKSLVQQICYALLVIIGLAPLTPITANLCTQDSRQTNLIVYSYDRPLQLYAFLESVDHYVTGLDAIYVIYRTSDNEYEKAYGIVKSTFKEVIFLAQSPPYQDLKKLTCQCLLKSAHPYLLFGVDDIIVKDFINLNECTQALEKYNAHGFFFRLGKNLDYCYAMGAPQPLPPLKNVELSICSWQFNQGLHDWNYPHNLDFTLYRIADIKDLIFSLDFTTPNSFESKLMGCVDYNKTGLCYESSKIVNFPLNIVQTEYPNNCENSYSTQQLLELFTQGLKIDLKPIDQIANSSAHINAENLIKFIPRQPLEEKLIVIVTPSYNNIEWWEWNLTSLLNQNYKNYRIIITDDCSTDGTGDAIENYIKINQLEHKVTLIKNKERRGALHNLYTMIHSCPNEAIIATVDGDDALPDPEVLNRLNYIYSTQEVWLTYGQFIEYPSNTKGWCTSMPTDVVQNNRFREYPHLSSHLRTYYAWLFKSIHPEDLLYNGEFYRMSWDYAMMLPMIEMAGERHKCFENEIMYVYNSANSINDHKISRQLQAHLSQTIRTKKRYSRLDKAQCKPTHNFDNEKAEMILFAEESDPAIVDAMLESIKKYVTNLAQIYIIYIEQPALLDAYQQMAEQYPELYFISIDQNRESFKSLLSVIYNNLINTNYVIFAKPDLVISESIDINTCIKAMEEYGAYSFSLTLAKECSATQSHLLPPTRMALLELENDLCMWNFATADGIWSCANNVNMTLYRHDNSYIRHILENCWMYTWVHFLGWWTHEGYLEKTGLCFKYSKVNDIQGT